MRGLALLMVVLVPMTTQAQSSSVPVRVMSFNIRYGTANDGENHWNKRKEFLVETITNFDPDLLGTQETLAFQRDYLAEKLSGYEVFAAGRDDGKDKGEMAALYYRTSRFEKLEGGHFWLSETPEKVGSLGWDAALPRIVTWVKLRDRIAGGPPILFLNTHFDHRGTKARQQSAQLIRAKLGELGAGCRLVVTGDFNAGEGSGPYQALFAAVREQPSPLVDTFRVRYPQRGKNEGTFTAFQASKTSGARIDWIACSRDWEVRLANIDRTAREGRTPSDHFAVTAVLRAVSDNQKPILRILCYNIHHGRGTDDKVDLLRLAKVIRAADPDLVALQEVDQKTKRTNGVEQTAELARLTDLYGRFGRAIDYQGGEYGQAILSRFPLGTSSIHQLPGEPEREQRIAFEVRLNLADQECSFVTTHLHHQQDKLRQRQATKLNELFAEVVRPVILAGDFNATPESQPMALLRKHWQIATSDPKLLTYPSEKPTKQIDYILYRPTQRFEVLEAKVIDEPLASDHRPVLAVLRLKRE